MRFQLIRAFHLLLALVTASIAVITLARGQDQPVGRREFSDRFSTTDGLPSNRVLCLLNDGSKVWAGTDRGLALIEDRKISRVFTVKDGLANAVVTALALDDRTGDLWVGTFGGLSRLSGGAFTNYSSLASGLANDVVYSVAVTRGRVWAATASGLSQLDLKSGSWTKAIFPNSDPLNVSTGAIVMTGDSAFVATWGDGEFAYRFAESKWDRVPLVEGQIQHGNFIGTVEGRRFVTGAAFDSERGVLWVATRAGVFSLRGDELGGIAPADERKLRVPFVNALRIRDDKLWLCSDSGLMAFDLAATTASPEQLSALHASGRSRSMSAPPQRGKREIAGRETTGAVFDIAFSHDEIWVATENGLLVGPRESATIQPPPGKSARARNGQSVRPRLVARPNMPAPESTIRSTFNLGFFGPLGDSEESVDGVSMLRGAQLAIDHANTRVANSKRILGVGQEFVLKRHDDSLPWGAGTAEPAKMVVTEDVSMILGSIAPSSSLQLARMSVELGIPIINAATSDIGLVEVAVPGLVHLFPSDRQQAEALCQQISTQRQIHLLGVLYEDEDYATGGVREFNQVASQDGRLTTIGFPYPVGSTSFKAVLGHLKAANVDGVLIWGHPNEAAAILREMRAIGMRIPTFGPLTLATPRLIERAGNAAEGFVAVSTFNPATQNENWQQFRSSYQDRFGEAPDVYAAFAFDATTIAMRILRRFGPDRSEARKGIAELADTCTDGVTGRVCFDKALNYRSSLVMARVEGARFVYWSLKASARSASTR